MVALACLPANPLFAWASSVLLKEEMNETSKQQCQVLFAKALWSSDLSSRSQQKKAWFLVRVVDGLVGNKQRVSSIWQATSTQLFIHPYYYK